MCRCWGGGPLLAVHCDSNISVSGKNFVKILKILRISSFRNQVIHSDPSLWMVPGDFTKCQTSHQPRGANGAKHFPSGGRFRKSEGPQATVERPSEIKIS